jgi:hypothetical protein
VLEDVVGAGDVWCTGTITSFFNNKPFLLEVSQTEFEAKLAGFVEQTVDRIFLVPEPNIHTEHSQRFQAHNVQILSLSNFRTLLPMILKAGRLSKQVIVTINGDELPLLVDMLFKQPSIMSRRKVLEIVASSGFVAVWAKKLTPYFPNRPFVPDEGSQTALRALWYQVLTLKAAHMSKVQAEVTNWFRTYETVKEADQLGISTVLMLIQELSRQESAIDLSHERERFLAEARRLAVEAQRAGAAYGPLRHYVQLRQAVL